MNKETVKKGLIVLGAFALGYSLLKFAVKTINGCIFVSQLENAINKEICDDEETGSEPSEENIVYHLI